MKEIEDIHTVTRNFEVKSHEDVAQVDEYLVLLKDSKKSILATLKNRLLEMESYFTKDITDNCGILNWDNRKVRFVIDRERVIIDFVYNIEKNRYVSTEIKIASSKYVFTDYCSGKYKTNIEKSGLELCDAYSIRYPNAEISLLELDDDSETEFIDMLAFVSREFRQRKNLGSLFFELKEFYLELVSYWNEIDKLDNTRNMLKYGRTNFLENECISKVRAMDMLKPGNVIIVFNKDKEETEFHAFEIESIGRKYYRIQSYTGVIDYVMLNISRVESEEDYANLSNDHYVNYLKIRQDNKSTLEFEKDALTLNLGKRFYKNGNIEVYTAEEWKDFLMLNKNETDHLLNSPKLSSEILELSNNYGRLRKIKSDSEM